MTASVISTAPLPSSVPSLPPASTAAAASTYTDLGGLAALKNAPNSPAAIHAVASQVEALFLQMMLKSMRDAGAAQGTEESNATSMYEDLFDKQVALTMAKHQDLGIARLFERRLGQASSGSTLPSAAAPGGAAQTSPTALPKRAADGRTPDSGATGGAGTLAEAAKFVAEVLPTLQRAAQTLGVNPLGLLAQAALETGWGQRMPRTADGSPSLNLFGIKAGEEWSGARAVADSVEFHGGVATQRRSTFRAYGSIEESVGDFAKLLKGSPRYRDAIAAGGSAQAYVEGIAKSGYATDPEYRNKLSQLLNGGTLRAALTLRLAAL